jgi:type II secretory pathway predicted ATPase ExeA
MSILEFEKKYKKAGLEYNPFTPDPLIEDNLSLFVGREKELERATNAIAKRKNVIISGWKGMGKTSFLSYLKAKVKSEKIMVSSMLATSEERPFFLSLLSGIFRENPIFKEDKVVSLIKENLRTYWKSPVAYPINLILEDILELIEHYRVVDFPLVVFIDEVQKLALPRAKHDLQVTLCDLMFKPNFVFVCAGMTSFFKMMEEPDAALADRFTPEGDIVLTPIKEKETKALIQRRLDEVRINQEETIQPFSSEVISLIHKYSQGNPRHIVNLSELILDSYIDEGEITKETVKNSAARLNLLFAQRALDQLSEETQEVFRAIADLSAGSPTSLSKAIGKPPSTIQYHLNTLKQAGLLVTKGKPPTTKYYIREEDIGELKKD